MYFVCDQSTEFPPQRVSKVLESQESRAAFLDIFSVSYGLL